MTVGVRPGVRIGVDVGTVRVGVAVSDDGGRLATPVDALRRDVRGDADLQLLAALVRERQAVEVLVGLPRSLSGGEGPAAAAAIDYATRLRAVVDVPVRLVDERLTTVEAQRGLRAAGVPGRRQRARVDSAAAVVLLQSALDRERTTGEPAGRAVDR